MKKSLTIVFAALLFLTALPGGMALAKDKQAEAKPALILVAEGFNRSEFWVPYLGLKMAGYQVDVASIKRGRVLVNPSKGETEHDAIANLSLDEVKPEKYIGLVIPGGYSPGNLEKHPKSIEIVQAFMKNKQPISGICHGPRLMMRAGVLEGRVITCLASVKDELADAWAKGKVGKYVDEPVVIDGNLITSRFPGDQIAFTQATLEMYEERGGLTPPKHEANAIVIYPGSTPHQRWVMRDIPQTNLVQSKVLQPSDISKFLAQDDSNVLLAQTDALIVIADKDAKDAKYAHALATHADYNKLVKNLVERNTSAHLIAAGGDAEKLFVAAKGRKNPTATVKSETPAILHAIRQHTHKGRQARIGETTTTTRIDGTTLAAIDLEPGFDDRMYASLHTRLAEALDVRAYGKEAGWIIGRQGTPVHVERWSEALNPIVHVKLDGKGKYSIQRADVNKVHPGFFDEAALKAPLEAAHAKPVPLDQANIAIALRKGFDGKAAAGLFGWFAAHNTRVAIVYHEKGEVRGINGITLQATATYDEAFKYGVENPRTGSRIIIAPGSFWPEKRAARQAEQPSWIDEQDKRDEKRKQWILDARKKGTWVMLVGMDSVQIGRDPVFKGKKFSAPSQAMWSFGKSGGRYSDANAMLSDERLVSAKGFEQVASALDLLMRTMAEARDVKLPGDAGAKSVGDAGKALVLNVLQDGTIRVEGKTLTKQQLKTRLATHSKQGEDVSVVIRADKHTEMQDIVAVINVVQEAGISKTKIGHTAAKSD